MPMDASLQHAPFVHLLLPTGDDPQCSIFVEAFEELNQEGGGHDEDPHMDLEAPAHAACLCM